MKHYILDCCEATEMNGFVWSIWIDTYEKKCYFKEQLNIIHKNMLCARNLAFPLLLKIHVLWGVPNIDLIGLLKSQ